MWVLVFPEQFLVQLLSCAVYRQCKPLSHVQDGCVFLNLIESTLECEDRGFFFFYEIALILVTTISLAPGRESAM